MIKLTELLKEEESFTATSKKSGETVVFKTKDARDGAVKAGTHSKIKDSDDGDDKKDTPKVNIFKKDKEEPKSQSKDTTDYSKLTTTPLVKKTKDDKGKIDKAVEDILAKADDVVKNGAADGGKSPRKMFKKLKDYIQGLRDTNQFDDDALNKAYYYANDVGNGYEYGGDENPKDSDEDSIKNSVKKIQALIKPKKDKEEPKKDKEEPKRDDNTDAQIEDVQNNIGDLDGDEIRDYAESDIFPYLKGRDLEYAKMFVDDIEDSGSDFVRSADLRNDLKKLFHKKMTLDAPSDSPKDESSTSLRDLLPESIINEGTRSQVGVIGRNGKIVSAYVHYDGYPSNMKPGLKHHMKSDKDVLKLIKMGGARGIFDDKEIEYYKNGKPTKGDMKDFGKYVDTADRSGGAEYIYLYNMKDKKWYFADVYGDKKLKKLF